jgi:two-component system NtrC family sensor kinase
LALYVTLTPQEIDTIKQFVLSHETKNAYLSTREERAKTNDLIKELTALNIENARNLSNKLVQIEVYTLGEEFKQFSQENLEKIISVLHSIFIKEKNCQTINTAVEKASRIVKALKVFLHTSEHIEPEYFDLKENIDTVLTIYQNQLKQGIQVHLNLPDLPKIQGFVDELNQVWTNLIVNACQAMQFNGTLSIEAKRNDESIVVAIKDTGEGIPGEVGDKIFNTFYTTKKSGEGSGLGLDIVRKILEKHKGKIWYESTLNVGTTFYVELPIAFHSV